MIWIYDIEVFSNFFTVLFLNPDTGEERRFTIYNNINDLDSLVSFINDHNKWLVGYNSFYFDNQVLQFMYKSHSRFTFSTVSVITKEIYNYSMRLIQSNDNKVSYNLPFRYIDLMKLAGLQKSLKLVGTILNWHKLQDLPYSVDKEISKEEVGIVYDYNRNDVLITKELYFFLLDEIKLRFEIYKQFGVEVFTESRSGTANRLLEKYYEEYTGIPKSVFKNERTPRKFFKFSSVIFNNVSFETNELDKEFEEIRDKSYYENLPFFKKVIKFRNKSYKLGIGGIHSIDEGLKIKSDKDVEIIDADVTSMYPSIIISYGIKPAHLNKAFLEIYSNFLRRRIKAKEEEDVITSEALKIVLNSVYGKMRNENHWLYDPFAAMQVTLNGQLFILMLIEKLELNGIQVISANTDGVTSIVPKEKKQIFKNICEEWSKKVRLNLEYTKYKEYIRKDVNNYIAIKDNGNIKTKGIFNKKKDIIKGLDKPIIAIAVSKYFLEGIPVEETIKNHDSIYDFCISKKIKNTFKNKIRYIKDNKIVEEYIQDSVRYYVSNTGVSLVKEKEIEKQGIYSIIDEETKEKQDIQYEVGNYVTIFNEFELKDDYDINYPYYISEAKKIIEKIDPLNKQLSIW